ncbi:unnamed protein product [Amoebophrya sp. A120]|nr:unnamed protein product [Amoebophrya sp. A120]|eukprot:GSA120T00001679001.1
MASTASPACSSPTLLQEQKLEFPPSPKIEASSPNARLRQKLAAGSAALQECAQQLQSERDAAALEEVPEEQKAAKAHLDLLERTLATEQGRREAAYKALRHLHEDAGTEIFLHVEQKVQAKVEKLQNSFRALHVRCEALEVKKAQQNTENAADIKQLQQELSRLENCTESIRKVFEKERDHAPQGHQVFSDTLDTLFPTLNTKMDEYVAETAEKLHSLNAVRSVSPVVDTSPNADVQVTPAEEFHAYCLEIFYELRLQLQQEKHLRRDCDEDLVDRVEKYAQEIQDGIRQRNEEGEDDGADLTEVLEERNYVLAHDETKASSTGAKDALLLQKGKNEGAGGATVDEPKTSQQHDHQGSHSDDNAQAMKAETLLPLELQLQAGAGRVGGEEETGTVTEVEGRDNRPAPQPTQGRLPDERVTAESPEKGPSSVSLPPLVDLDDLGKVVPQPQPPPGVRSTSRPPSSRASKVKLHNPATNTNTGDGDGFT